MILLNERHQVKEAIRKWAARYGLDPYFGDGRDGIGPKLMALDQETATAEDVAKIIGNTSWVRPRACNECGAETWEIVEIGEPPDYESWTANVCRECLLAALRLFGDEQNAPSLEPSLEPSSMSDDIKA